MLFSLCLFNGFNVLFTKEEIISSPYIFISLISLFGNLLLLMLLFNPTQIILIKHSLLFPFSDILNCSFPLSNICLKFIGIIQGKGLLDGLFSILSWILQVDSLVSSKLLLILIVTLPFLVEDLISPNLVFLLLVCFLI